MLVPSEILNKLVKSNGWLNGSHLFLQFSLSVDWQPEWSYNCIVKVNLSTCNSVGVSALLSLERRSVFSIHRISYRSNWRSSAATLTFNACETFAWQTPSSLNIDQLLQLACCRKFHQFYRTNEFQNNSTQKRIFRKGSKIESFQPLRNPKTKEKK